MSTARGLGWVDATTGDEAYQVRTAGATQVGLSARVSGVQRLAVLGGYLGSVPATTVKRGILGRRDVY